MADSLPAGVATELGERGRFLSGGQSQRVALARALAADAPVLVLHDPTTAVDSVTEQHMADGLRALRHDRTTLVITTSPALLAACTRVVLVGRKGIRVYGTHQSLAGRGRRVPPGGPGMTRGPETAAGRPAGPAAHRQSGPDLAGVAPVAAAPSGPRAAWPSP